MYTARHYCSVSQNSLVVYRVMAFPAYHYGLSPFRYHNALPQFLAGEVFDFVDVMDFIVFAFRRAAQFTLVRV
jgi:hypothetical protein